MSIITKVDPFDLTACEFHAERSIGPWRIERRTLERSLLSFRPRDTPPGTYTGLLKNGAVWMSDVPDEKRDHYGVYFEAQRRGGRVLVHGLGLGMVVKAMLDLPNVGHVDVVEIDSDVIDLCGPAFDVYGARVTIHHGDCLSYRWPTGTRWTVVWHDIWRDICTDNLAEMATLHRKFGRRCDWQGSWSREQLQRERRREQAWEWR